LQPSVVIATLTNGDSAFNPISFLHSVRGSLIILNPFVKTKGELDFIAKAR